MNVVISGTSRGIGRGIAQYLLEKGDTVLGCSRGESTIDHPHYHHAEVDVSDSIQVRDWVASIKRDYRWMDALICNAGLAPANLLTLSTSDDALNGLLRTNIGGSFSLCRDVSKVMLLQKFGRIITVSSMAVGLHEEGTGAYSASKAAIVEFTKILAKEVSLFGITANVLAPSMIYTDAVGALGEEVRKRALSKLTIKREVTLSEICNVVDFFLKPESACITGQVIHMGLVV